MTPRKPRQTPGGRQPRRNVPSTLIQASEYESDVPSYNPPPLRSNSEMNLAVLRRYNPAIRSIACHAANAVIYVFTPSTQAWEKSGVEGTLFVCEQEPSYETGTSSCCIFVLNRRGLDNLILDLSQTQDVEVTSELLIMRFNEAGQPDEDRKVMGIWIHDNNDDREKNSRMIQEFWERARASWFERSVAIDRMSYGMGEAPSTMADVQPEAMGRRISLRELFQQNSNP